MSDYNERNSRPAERLTVAGIAAVVVVGVFVICVILILAKSLFPSNDDSTVDSAYTSTTSSSVSAPDTESKAADDNTAYFDSSADDASITDDSESETESAASVESADSGTTATLTQTAYLRSGNDENSDPILSISSGETVTVLGTDDTEYVHVSYYGTEGYVWYGYLSY